MIRLRQPAREETACPSERRMAKSLQLSWIQEKVKSNEYLYTFHADTERRDDGLSTADVQDALLSGAILEDYPNDPRGPCLLYGRAANRPIHVVCGQNRSGWLVLITVYVPAIGINSSGCVLRPLHHKQSTVGPRQNWNS